VNKKAV